jgi:hypothetical protein
MSTGKIVEVRKDVFAADVVVKDPATGQHQTVKGRLIEAGTDYIQVSIDGVKNPERIAANLRDVQIPRDQQVVGLAVKFDTVGDHVRAVNVVAA